MLLIFLLLSLIHSLIRHSSCVTLNHFAPLSLSFEPYPPNIDRFGFVYTKVLIQLMQAKAKRLYELRLPFGLLFFIFSFPFGVSQDHAARPREKN